jgi:hypothetical protein
MGVPLCPLVLQLVAAQPRGVGGVARELSRRGLAPELAPEHAASVTLGRLRTAGLVYATGAPRVFRISARGRRELELQRRVTALSARDARRSAHDRLLALGRTLSPRSQLSNAEKS